MSRSHHQNQPTGAALAQPGAAARAIDPAKAAIAGPAPIKVRELRFRAGSPFGASNVVAREATNGIITEIQFEPWQRHHRVREFENGKVRNEYCVPESWCVYYPLAED